MKCLQLTIYKDKYWIGLKHTLKHSELLRYANTDEYREAKRDEASVVSYCYSIKKDREHDLGHSGI